MNALIKKSNVKNKFMSPRFPSLKAITTAAFLFTAALSVAQDNYTIKMNLKSEGLPAEYAAFGEMDILTYIKGDKLRTERNGMTMTSVSVYDGKKMTSLNDVMGNKSGFVATKEELNTPEKNAKTEKPKIEYTTEKKMIAGYECTKVIATTVDKDKKENKMILWVTDKIKYSHPEAHKASGRGMPDMSDLKGYPLSMEMSQNAQGMEIKIIMTTTEVLTTPVDDSVFTLNTEGYTMMSYKDMQDKQRAMMQQGK